MIYLAWFVLIFIALRAAIALVNAITINHLGNGRPDGQPLVSVLVPARNEESTLPLLLNDLMGSDYKALEVLVCNDHSTDATVEILGEYSSKMKNLTWFTSEPLPDGWIGKNFACYQLAQRVSGKYLLFLDADVRVSKHLVTYAVGYMQRHRYDLVSVFPKQIMLSFAEWASVPIMNWILVALLPIPLVRLTRFPTLAAANGQFMLFQGESYHKNLWHHRVKGENTEDIVIARLIKKSGGMVSTLLGNNDVSCRMYSSLALAIKGFSRNAHHYFGGSRMLMTVFSLIVLAGWMPVWLYGGWELAKWYFLLVLVCRLMVALASRQPIATVWLHPVQMIIFTWIVLINIYNNIRGETEWKGRKISF